MCYGYDEKAGIVLYGDNDQLTVISCCKIHKTNLYLRDQSNIKSKENMHFLQIYLQKRMTWDGSKLLRHTMQFLAVLSSVFTAMTRVSDYKHHWSDVLCGLLLGTTVAWIVVSVHPALKTFSCTYLIFSNWEHVNNWFC